MRTYVGMFHGIEVWADDEIPVGMLVDRAILGEPVPAPYVGRHRLTGAALARVLTEWLSHGDWSPNDCRAWLGLLPVDAPYAWERSRR